MPNNLDCLSAIHSRESKGLPSPNLLSPFILPHFHGRYGLLPVQKNPSFANFSSHFNPPILYSVLLPINFIFPLSFNYPYMSQRFSHFLRFFLSISFSFIACPMLHPSNPFSENSHFLNPILHLVLFTFLAFSYSMLWPF